MMRYGMLFWAIFGLSGCTQLTRVDYENQRFQDVDASQIDQRTVNLVLTRDADFRKLERRIDAIRRGEIILYDKDIVVEDAYSIEESVPKKHLIKEYDSTIGIVKTVSLPQKYTYEVAYEFPDKDTADYFWFALTRLKITDKMRDNDDDSRIVVGTYSSSLDALKRKAALNYILDLDLALIRKKYIQY